MKDIESVRIELQYSRVGAAILAVAACLTAVVSLATPMSPGLRVALLGWIAAATLEALERVVFVRGARAARALRVQRDGRIEVESASGERMAGALRPGSFVAPWLVVVRWRPENRRRDRTVLLLPDMVAAGDFRRLRVLLRWARGEP